MIRLETAKPEDQGRLVALLWENGMGYVDPIEDFLLVRKGEEIVGCGRSEDYPDIAMIRPVVVAEVYRNQGIGRLLLERITSRGKPTLVVARGESVAFYEAFGFLLVDWKKVPAHQKDECTSCPDRTECRPQPMIYNITRTQGGCLEG